MKRISKYVLVLAMVTGMAFESAAPALADKTVSTSLTLSVNHRKIHKGKRVVFSGRLRSKNKKCRAHSTIVLLKGGVFYRSTTTTSTGAYKFRVKPKKTAVWQTRFPGKHFGVHPKKVKCTKSRSRKIKVTVKH